MGQVKKCRWELSESKYSQFWDWAGRQRENHRALMGQLGKCRWEPSESKCSSFGSGQKTGKELNGPCRGLALKLMGSLGSNWTKHYIANFKSNKNSLQKIKISIYLGQKKIEINRTKFAAKDSDGFTWNSKPWPPVDGHHSPDPDPTNRG